MRLITLVLSTAIIVALTGGCASLPAAKSLLKNEYSEKRRQRNEEVVRSFEASRDQTAYEAALARWEQNDSKGCRESLEPLLARNPKHIDAQLLLAEVNLLDNRTKEALNQVDEALRMQPNNARALYSKGLVLDAMGQSTDSLAYYEQAVRAEPENEIYSICYQNAKGSDGSNAALSDNVIAAGYTDASKSDNNFAPMPRDQGPALKTPATGRHQVGSPSAEMPALELPDKAKKNAGFSDSYAHAESVVSAEEFLSEGQRALSDGSAEAARIAFHKATACQPNNPEIPLVSGGAALRTNHPELAVELLTHAAKHFSKSAAIYRMLGVAYYRLGDYQLSQVALQQALSLDKSSALSYFLMGCTLAKLGQAEPAEAHFQQAKAIDPRYAVRR